MASRSGRSLPACWPRPPRDGEGGEDDEDGDRAITDLVEQPAKVMRIGSMIRQLLEEVKAAPLDEASRNRLKEIHQASIKELETGLAPELVEELERLSLPFTEDSVPSESELRIAQAQLVGWLEGLFHGIQTAIYAQQMAARAQFEQMRQALPPGAAMPGARPGSAPATRTRPRVPASRAGCTSSGLSAPGRAGPQPDEDQAEQADDHQCDAGGGQPGQAVRLGVVDLGELRGLRLRLRGAADLAAGPRNFSTLPTNAAVARSVPPQRSVVNEAPSMVTKKTYRRSASSLPSRQASCGEVTTTSAVRTSPL